MESENRKNSKEFEEFPLIENIVGRGAKATHDPLPVEKRPFFCTILAAKKNLFSFTTHWIYYKNWDSNTMFDFW